VLIRDRLIRYDQETITGKYACGRIILIENRHHNGNHLVVPSLQEETEKFSTVFKIRRRPCFSNDRAHLSLRFTIKGVEKLIAHIRGERVFSVEYPGEMFWTHTYFLGELCAIQRVSPDESVYHINEGAIVRHVMLREERALKTQGTDAGPRGSAAG
jgi:hypothetical protein